MKKNKTISIGEDVFNLLKKRKNASYYIEILVREDNKVIDTPTKEIPKRLEHQRNTVRIHEK